VAQLFSLGRLAFMTIKRRIAYSVALGLIFDIIGFVTLRVADGVWFSIPFSPQYFVLRLVFPILGIHEDELGSGRGLLWLFMIPWLAWTVAIYLLMYVMRKDKRAA
jgi:hypothetical protein